MTISKVRANGMRIFPVVISAKASEGDTQRAMQLEEVSVGLRGLAKLSARERRSRRSGLGSLLRVE